MADVAVVTDFDFLVGEWAIQNKRRKVRLLTDAPEANQQAEWEEFPATMIAEVGIEGRVLVDHYKATLPNGAFVDGMTVRAYDYDKQEWSILWLDNRQPPDFDPLRGKFTDGVGIFEQMLTTAEGRPFHVRFTWDQITGQSARWQQAFSMDGGATWDTNWIMHMTKQS